MGLARFGCASAAAAVVVWAWASAGGSAAAAPGEGPGIRAARVHPRLLDLALDAAVSPSARGPVRRDRSGRVRVHLVTEEVTPALLADLLALGARIEHRRRHAIQASLPVSALRRAARLPGVRRLGPPLYVRGSAGSATTQGDTVHALAQVRLQEGLSGAGVRVGVISDGIAGLGAAIASGDLPPTDFHCEGALGTVTVRAGPCQVGEVLVRTLGGVHGTPFPEGADLGEAGRAEGTAMLELVHDVAPGAELWFASVETSLDLEAAVAHLAQHVDVIVSNVVVPGAFPDGKSTVTRALAEALAQAGARTRLFVQASGNHALAHYAGPYVDSGEGDAFGNYHRFEAAGDTSGPPGPRAHNRVVLPPGALVDVVLTWDDPAGASANDFDLLLYECTGGALGDLLDLSIDVQDGDPVFRPEPVEWVSHVNLGPADMAVCYVIQNVADAAGSRLLNVTLSTTGTAVPALSHDYNTPAQSVLPPADLPGPVLVIGAVGAATPDAIEPYSARGPTFDGRTVPHVVAVDGVAVSGAGGFPTPFFGTSASASHVGGLAALLLELNPTLTAAQLREVIVQTAVPLGVASTYGAGRIDAVAAAAAARVGPTPPLLAAAVLPGSRSVQVGTPATVFATILNAGPGTATVCGVAPPAGLAASFSYQTTDPATNAAVGSADTPASVPAGGGQSFVVAITPSAPMAPTDVAIVFDCANAGPAPSVVGLNTLLLSASPSAGPDIVALAATLGGNGIVDVPGPAGTGAFAVATVNVGAAAVVSAGADTGTTSLPVSLLLCETEPVTGSCKPGQGPAGSVTTTIGAGATPTFAVFVSASGAVPFAPGTSRVFVRFTDAGGVVRGSTSVAVRTQP